MISPLLNEGTEIAYAAIRWEFKNNKNAAETVKKICNVSGQSVFTDHKVQNCFSKFHSALGEEPRPGCSSVLDQDDLRICTWPKLIPIYNISLLEKNRKNKHENLRKCPEIIRETMCITKIIQGYILYDSCRKKYLI